MTVTQSTDLMQSLRDLAETATRAADTLAADIAKAVEMFRDAVRSGGTLYFCGNGGSAADSQHMATEYVVRYMKKRRAYPAVALTTDTSLITATGNDLSFDEIFSRQVEALAKPGDLLIIHSTSGNSPNVLLAADTARAQGVATLALIARDGGALRSRVDHAIVVPTNATSRAQEIHLCIEHLICETIEKEL